MTQNPELSALEFMNLKSRWEVGEQVSTQEMELLLTTWQRVLVQRTGLIEEIQSRQPVVRRLFSNAREAVAFVEQSLRFERQKRNNDFAISRLTLNTTAIGNQLDQQKALEVLQGLLKIDPSYAKVLSPDLLAQVTTLGQKGTPDSDEGGVVEIQPSPVNEEPPVPDSLVNIEVPHSGWADEGQYEETDDQLVDRLKQLGNVFVYQDQEIVGKSGQLLNVLASCPSITSDLIVKILWLEPGEQAGKKHAGSLTELKFRTNALLKRLGMDLEILVKSSAQDRARGIKGVYSLVRTQVAEAEVEKQSSSSFEDVVDKHVGSVDEARLINELKQLGDTFVYQGIEFKGKTGQLLNILSTVPSATSDVLIRTIWLEPGSQIEKKHRDNLATVKNNIIARFQKMGVNLTIVVELTTAERLRGEAGVFKLIERSSKEMNLSKEPIANRSDLRGLLEIDQLNGSGKNVVQRQILEMMLSLSPGTEITQPAIMEQLAANPRDKGEWNKVCYGISSLGRLVKHYGWRINVRLGRSNQGRRMNFYSLVPMGDDSAVEIAPKPPQSSELATKPQETKERMIGGLTQTEIVTVAVVMVQRYEWVKSLLKQLSTLRQETIPELISLEDLQSIIKTQISSPTVSMSDEQLLQFRVYTLDRVVSVISALDDNDLLALVDSCDEKCWNLFENMLSLSRISLSIDGVGGTALSFLALLLAEKNWQALEYTIVNQGRLVEGLTSVYPRKKINVLGKQKPFITEEETEQVEAKKDAELELSSDIRAVISRLEAKGLVRTMTYNNAQLARQGILDAREVSYLVDEKKLFAPSTKKGIKQFTFGQVVFMVWCKDLGFATKKYEGRHKKLVNEVIATIEGLLPDSF